MACFLRTEELQDRMQKAYGEAFTIPEGLLGDPAKLPTQLLTFSLVMLFLASLSIYVMNKRKMGILQETYSKLSIFKTK